MKRFVLFFPAFLIILGLSPLAFGLSTDNGNIELSAGNITGFTLNRGDATKAESSRQVPNYELMLGFSTATYGIGYFVMDDLSLGGSFSVYMSGMNNQSGTHSIIDIDGFIKYYVPITSNVFALYKGILGFETVKPYNHKTSISQFSLGMGTSIGYVFNDYIGLFGSFDYRARLSAFTGLSSRSGIEQYIFSLGIVTFIGDVN